METSPKDFEAAEIKMNELLAVATQKGGFDNLTSKERAALNKYTQKVKAYEAMNFEIPLPQTYRG